MVAILLVLVTRDPPRRPVTSPVEALATGPLPSLEQVPRFDAELSVVAAYEALGSRQTTYDAFHSDIPREDQAYLTLVFAAIDQAIVLRVETTRRFMDEEAEGLPADLAEYDTLVAFLKAVPPPEKLHLYHRALTRSVQDHRAFFEEWRQRGAGFPYRELEQMPKSPTLRRASKGLDTAYGALLKQYP